MLVSPVLQRPKLVFSVFNYIHFSVHTMIFPCGFNSCSHGDQCWDSFHVFIGHLSICHFKIRWLLINGLQSGSLQLLCIGHLQDMSLWLSLQYRFIFLCSLLLTPKVFNFNCWIMHFLLCCLYFRVLSFLHSNN